MARPSLREEAQLLLMRVQTGVVHMPMRMGRALFSDRFSDSSNFGRAGRYLYPKDSSFGAWMNACAAQPMTMATARPKMPNFQLRAKR